MAMMKSTSATNAKGRASIPISIEEEMSDAISDGSAAPEAFRVPKALTIPITGRMTAKHAVATKEIEETQIIFPQNFRFCSLGIMFLVGFA
jgi:hypothetical protein